MEPTNMDSAPKKVDENRTISNGDDFQAYQVARRAEDYLWRFVKNWGIAAFITAFLVIVGGFWQLHRLVADTARDAARSEADRHTEIIKKNISLLENSFLAAQGSFEERRRDILERNIQLHLSIEELGSKLATTSSELLQSNRKIEDVSQQISVVSGKVNSITASIEALEISTRGIEDRFSSLQGEIDLTTNRIDAAHEDIDAIMSNLKTTQADLEDYSRRLGELTKITSIIYNLSKADDESFLAQVSELTREEKEITEGWPLVRRVAAERLLGILDRAQDDKVIIGAIELFISLNGIESREAWIQDYALREGIRLDELDSIQRLSLNYDYPAFAQEQPIISSLPDTLIRIVEDGNEEPAKRAGFLLSRLHLTHQQCSDILNAIKRGGPFKNINLSGLLWVNPSLREYAQKPLIEWALGILNDEAFIEMRGDDIEARYLELMGILQLAVIAADSDSAVPLYARGIELLETESNGDLIAIGVSIFLVNNGISSDAPNDILRLIEMSKGKKRRIMTYASGFTKHPNDALLDALFELTRSRDREVSQEAVMALVRLSHRSTSENLEQGAGMKDESTPPEETWPVVTDEPKKG